MAGPEHPSFIFSDLIPPLPENPAGIYLPARDDPDTRYHVYRRFNGSYGIVIQRTEYPSMKFKYQGEMMGQWSTMDSAIQTLKEMEMI